ncbi:MAG: YopX family protein [bacterium]|nr:YopX family protein [bacterium]
MYRVYNTEDKCWVEDNIYMKPNGDLFMIKQSVFGWIKFPLELSSDKYICHKYIGINDKYGFAIYEGDYIKAKISDEKTVVGIVTYAEELSAYVILCEDTSEFYTLGSEVCDYIEIIGNVFDRYTEVDYDDK